MSLGSGTEEAAAAESRHHKADEGLRATPAGTSDSSRWTNF